MNDNTKTVELTKDEIFTLRTYIRETTKSRKDRIIAWEKMATEKRLDGSLKFPSAEENASFLREENERLAAIMKKLEG